ncbi:ubiquinone biosynthesis monooxygenase Coq7 [Apophysomyces sp. BC1034]|nr:ubiquinone biosynthesis monooxygenase Coq7 [Apophysomyces sp. BC1034]
MLLDELIGEFDRGLRSITGVAKMSRPAPRPDVVADDSEMTVAEQSHAAGLMRALYQAQKLATRSERLKQAFERAAREEEDHLAWTAQRLRELDARPSLLNPLWYAGSLAIGLVAGRFGNRVSLGFMAETERQVEQHLDGHLDRLPAADHASRAIVMQMRTDEIAHARSASDAGGVTLPAPVTALMRMAARVMTRTAYYI